MKKHKVTVVPKAKKKMRGYLSYLLLVLQSEQAYDAVKQDYYETIDELSNIAGSHQEPPEKELAERGLKRMHFLHHKYVMLYEMDGDEAVVTYIFHESEDYINKLN